MAETPESRPTPDPDGEGAPKKRRPKDSEFFELPPDLKKMQPGELPATAGMGGGPKHKGGDTRKSGESPEKKGCAGLLLACLAAGAAAACLILMTAGG